VPTRPAAACLLASGFTACVERFVCPHSLTAAPPLSFNGATVKWNSEYFRQTYLIPLLELQGLQGHLYLAPYDWVLPGSRLSDAFYSYHAYRRGGRTHVKQKRAGCIRKATPEETYGHGRWRLARSGLPIDSQYDQPPVLDQLAISLFSL
jgi:hypothetical protein